MGINGLLQQLKSISRATHVSSYRGQKVAVDGYSWLHKGAYSCSRELCEGVWTDGYVRYFISRVEMLLSNGVIPVIVFDGCRLPMKQDEEESRRRSRREAMERARAHAESGNMAAATECYQRAVDIAPWMARVVMEALRERGVQCMVAPYEADAQMSYLALRGDVFAVLTEDSDMLAYGCPRVLYKLDRGGNGEEVLLADLPLVRELNMMGFDHDMLLQMCILAGCDFLSNLSGVGIKKAHALMRKHRNYKKVLGALRFNGTSPPAGYDARFQRAIWVFRHQRVFCPASRKLAHLRPLPPGGIGAADVLCLEAIPPEGPEREELRFLGPPMADDIAAGIAEGIQRYFQSDPKASQQFRSVRPGGSSASAAEEAPQQQRAAAGAAEAGGVNGAPPVVTLHGLPVELMERPARSSAPHGSAGGGQDSGVSGGEAGEVDRLADTQQELALDAEEGTAPHDNYASAGDGGSQPHRLIRSGAVGPLADGPDSQTGSQSGT
ncbi:hypothetical protein GPECTOR_6g608 [Gonium pectorale]|uniref:Exonuclease 1 n=1 Tax=Gonium pectorale TaxID=33097 RepID=A0A150GV31_GONPE|nr:hypothetical protein GPECTOR_6g608 [Gonium pectorale]|eukprot:KXZ53691.1 hypothetical protein GPECTOR_6g608 [Gonium pectorale]